MADTKMTLRLPLELDGRLRAVADREHRSNHAQVLVYIERGLAADETKNGTEPVTHYSHAATERSLAGDIHGTLACGAYHWGLVSDDPALVTCEPCKAALRVES